MGGHAPTPTHTPVVSLLLVCVHVPPSMQPYIKHPCTHPHAHVHTHTQRRGKKALVLDPHISGFLGVFAEVSLLREHGVEQLFHLGTESLADVTAKTVVYLISNRIDTAQQVARHIREGIRYV